MKTHIPLHTRKGVTILVRSLACHSDGRPFSARERVTNSNLFSRTILELRSSDECAVHRVAALVLLQSGGEAHFSRTMHDSFGRYLTEPVYLGIVDLPAKTEVVL